MRELWKGNEAIAEAAVRAGVDAFFGYPITPQTELLEYMAKRLPELGRIFVQAESEIAAINMVYGAACTGIRAMTSSSSPGISLMQEGLSYIAASEVPCVIVDVMRGGPGLGNIQPGQADYFQVTHSAGHGDFHPLVLAPSTVQEAVDLTYASFELAMRYRTIVLLAADGAIGQMMEPVSMPPMCTDPLPPQPWALTGALARDAREITSLQLQPEELEKANLALQAKLARIAAAEVRYESYQTEDADILVVAFGTVARIARSAVRSARAMGIRAGLFRPITLWPFPAQALNALSRQVSGVLVVEMNAGQMADDVRRCVSAHTPVHFRGRMGGMIPMPDEILGELAYLRRVYSTRSDVGARRVSAD